MYNVQSITIMIGIFGYLRFYDVGRNSIIHMQAEEGSVCTQIWKPCMLYPVLVRKGEMLEADCLIIDECFSSIERPTSVTFSICPHDNSQLHKFPLVSGLGLLTT